MVEKKAENERMVRVTVRISVPDVTLEGVAQLAIKVEKYIEGLEGATYDLSISSPRPERPR